MSQIVTDWVVIPSSIRTSTNGASVWSHSIMSASMSVEMFFSLKGLYAAREDTVISLRWILLLVLLPGPGRGKGVSGRPVGLTGHFSTILRRSSQNFSGIDINDSIWKAVSRWLEASDIIYIQFFGIHKTPVGNLRPVAEKDAKAMAAALPRLKFQLAMELDDDVSIIQSQY
jgi:hypothetical protein